MADLKFVDQHNMVACLEKTEENAYFHQIVDFLSTCSINYALTAVVISESSVRSDLLFNDEDGIACLTNDEIFENLALMGYEQLSTKHTFQKGNGYRWQSQAPRNHGGALAQTSVPPTPYDSPLTGGYTPKSDEGRLKLKELMAICTKLSKHMLDLEKEKDVQAVEILKLSKELEIRKKRMSSISTPRRRIYRRLESSVMIWMGGMDCIQTGEGKVTRQVNIPRLNDSPRPIRSITTLQPLPTINPKDKELAQRLHEEELAELDRAQKERQKQEEATSAALAEEFDEIQARIDVDHELAVRLTHEEQEKYTIEERARLLAEFFERRKKQLAAERAEAIRNKPPTRTQVRNRMITYLKHMDDDSQQQAESTKKRPRADSEEESSKKQKLKEDNDVEKEELRDSTDVVPRDDVVIDVESLATKYPIVDCRMLDDFDRQYVIDLHSLVNERYETTSPEGYDLLLWGDLKTLFEPNEEDEIWKNQQDYNLISWRLFDSCGVHVLLMNNVVAIHMMIEKKYPLTQEILSRMLNRRLEVDYESEMAFELLIFTRSQLQK
ncbi:hypothetical protein Tco_0474235 [Tanacetum coccineum]